MLPVGNRYEGLVACARGLRLKCELAEFECNELRESTDTAQSKLQSEVILQELAAALSTEPLGVEQKVLL
jgi:hypothetical protein